MNDDTKARVAARPTPSAPAPPWKPRWQLMMAMAPPKNIGLIRPTVTSQRSTKPCEFCQ